MGYFLSRFRKDTLVLHNIVEKKPYIDRYIDEGRDENIDQPESGKRYHHEQSLTLLDHYRHLCQLLPIYETLESKIGNSDFAPAFPNKQLDLVLALKQANKIKSDIAFLRPHIHADNQDAILESTRNYVDSLAMLEVNKNAKSNEVMAHYLVRILGDLFGGQSIKKYVNTMYARNGISKTDPDDGVKFCCFEKNTLIYLINWLNSLLKDERPANLLVVDEDPLSILTLEDYEKIVEAANSSFSTHIAIYDELEKTRTRAAALEESAKAQAASLPQGSPVSVANNNNSFFSQHSSAITAAAAAALATGLLVVGAFVTKP